MPLKLPGFSVWIDCEGSELACHAVECSDDGKTATCWIASEVEKTFSVRWSRECCDTTQAMSGRVYIDGVRCDMMRRMEADKPSLSHSQTCNLLANESEYTETDNAQRIGDIELKIYHHKDSTIIPATWMTDDPLGEPKIHERAKKATSHKVKLGDEIKSQNNTELNWVTLGEKLANFTFKYRPIDVLRANGIILNTETDVGPNFATTLKVADHPESPAQIDGSSVAPITVKEEASEEGARAANVALQDLHIKIEAETQETNGTQVVARHDEEEEDVDVARLQALKRESQKLERKIEMKALRKRLADLEREDNGDASTSQGPAKKARTDATGSIAGVQRNARPSTSQVPAARVKRRSSIMDLTGDSD